VFGDRELALSEVKKVRTRWQWLYDNLDTPLTQAEKEFSQLGINAGEFTNRAEQPTLFHVSRLSYSHCQRVRTFLTSLSASSRRSPISSALFVSSS
jgi:hypothetical protein